MRTNESRDEGPLNAKYPKTLYWPWSPSISRGDGVHPDSSRFVGEPVVVTEKLDGGNTLLHAGKVHARSVAAPSEGKWMAMVKKHHAWKVHESGVHLYGEDIYGAHSSASTPGSEFRRQTVGLVRVGRAVQSRAAMPTSGPRLDEW